MSPEISDLSHLTTLRRNITKSSEPQTPQSNSNNAPPANKSRNNSQADANSSQSVPTSHASGTSKFRTTSVNGVAVARSGNMNSKSKKSTKKSRVTEISDPEDDDSLEREVILASPAKGAEFHKAATVSKSFIYLHIYVLKNIVIVRTRSPRWEARHLQV